MAPTFQYSGWRHLKTHIQKHCVFTASFLDLVGTKERVRGHGLKIVLPTPEDSTLKPPISLSTTALPGAANLLFSGPFEHIFKCLAVEVCERRIPRAGDCSALNSGCPGALPLAR